MIDCNREWIKAPDWQVDNRQAPCRRNKLSLSSSIICVDIYASKSTVRTYKAVCISSPPPQSQHGLTGGWLGQGYTDPFTAPSQRSNWKIWVALLVCFGGMWWVVFFEAFPQCCCSVDLRVTQVSGVRLSIICGTAFFSHLCLLFTVNPPDSLLPADRLAGPLVFTVWFLWPSQTWMNRQRSFGLGKQITRQLEEAGPVPLWSVYLVQTYWTNSLITELKQFDRHLICNYFHYQLMV